MATWTSYTDTTAGAPDPPPRRPPEPKPTRPKPRGVSPEQLAKIGPLAAALFVAILLGSVAAWERMPGGGGDPYGGVLYVHTPGARGSMSSLRSASARGGGRHRVPVPQPPDLARFDELPDYGGAETPRSGDAVRLALLEEGLRRRLRAEGRLPPEPGGMEQLRRRFGTVGDAMVRFALQREGQP